MVTENKEKERYLKLINRMAQIKKKGFNMIGTEDYQILNQANDSYIPVDFAKIRVGVKNKKSEILRFLFFLFNSSSYLI